MQNAATQFNYTPAITTTINNGTFVTQFVYNSTWKGLFTNSVAFTQGTAASWHFPIPPSQPIHDMCHLMVLLLCEQRLHVSRQLIGASQRAMRILPPYALKLAIYVTMEAYGLTRI